jgi:hypothetical protein
MSLENSDQEKKSENAQMGEIDDCSRPRTRVSGQSRREKSRPKSVGSGSSVPDAVAISIDEILTAKSD